MKLKTKTKMKNKLKFILEEFIYGGHLTSLGASAILLLIPIVFDQKINIPFFILGYLIFQIIYSYNHFKELKKDSLTNFKRVRHLEKSKAYFPIIFTSYWIFFIFILIYLNNLNVVFLSLFIITGGLLYTEFFKNLSKKIIGFKTFYVAFFWALLVMLGGTYYNIPFNSSMFLLFSFVFLYGIFNTIFFDLKDLETDKKEGLKTFPVLLGKKKTLNLLYMVNFFSFIPLIIGIYKDFFSSFFLSLVIFYLYRIYCLEKIKNEKTNIQYLSYTLIDGECIFWPFILILSKFINNLWQI